MPTTIREQVISAFLGVLEGITDPDPLYVERNRDVEVQRFPTIVLLDGAHNIGESEHGLHRYAMTLSVEGYVQAETDSQLGATANALYGSIMSAVMADRQLGGLAIDIHEQNFDIVVGRGEGHKPSAAFSIEFLVDFFTRENDPFSSA